MPLAFETPPSDADRLGPIPPLGRPSVIRGVCAEEAAGLAPGGAAARTLAPSKEGCDAPLRLDATLALLVVASEYEAECQPPGRRRRVPRRLRQRAGIRLAVRGLA